MPQPAADAMPPGGAGKQDDAAAFFGSLMDLLRRSGGGVAELVRGSFDARVEAQRSCGGAVLPATVEGPVMVNSLADMVRPLPTPHSRMCATACFPASGAPSGRVRLALATKRKPKQACFQIGQRRWPEPERSAAPLPPTALAA